jgi:hypothetical protein
VANDISSRTWFIDTAGAGVIFQPQVYIKFIEVINTDNAHAPGTLLASITDRNTKEIIRALSQIAANTAGEIQTYNLENWFEGFIAPTLSVGTTLRVHVK